MGLVSGVGVLVVGLRHKTSPRNLTVDRRRSSLHILAEWERRGRWSCSWMYSFWEQDADM